MRPGGDVLGARPRKDVEPSVPTTPLGHCPMSFSLRREDVIEGDDSSEKTTESRSDSSFGVQSLPNTTHEVHTHPKNAKEGEDECDHESGAARRRSTLKPGQNLTRDSSRESSGHTQVRTGDSSPYNPSQEGPSPPSISHSLASLSLDSQAPLSSMPSSPKSTSNKSFRPSDDDSMDEAGSQAIISSEEDDSEPHSELLDSAPQLIMPSIKMPSRRPFTERGKGMGRFKILIAGDSGVGKTSLIKSIVQTCEDIVHVDPLSASISSINQRSSRKSRSRLQDGNATSTQQITEVHASTKAYPTWWFDIEDVKVLRRRKSMGDTVLERNLCFVDTPGYSHGISRLETIETILQYVQAQLLKSVQLHKSNDGDIVGLLSGNGGSQVDLVLYMVAGDIKDEDIVFLHRLASLTNVIPLIAKSDTLSPEENGVLRRSIEEIISQTGIQCFTFNTHKATTTPPYTVCSAPSDDNDNMDASMLMSPDYVQPLIPSDLSTLIQQLFAPETVSCLRYLAAKRLVLAQGASTSQSLRSIPKTMANLPSSSTTSTTTHPTTPDILSHAHDISPYLQARIADHTQQEERLAQIRLAKWAGDLQRSLRNEREQYEALAHGERANWLSRRLGECVNDNALVHIQKSVPATGEELSQSTSKSEFLRFSSSRGLLDSSDPLGLVRWKEAMRRRGWIAFQIVGGFGVVGAVAVWMARTWGSGSDAWAWGWLGVRV